jgi:hypothetical protein
VGDATAVVGITNLPAGVAEAFLRQLQREIPPHSPVLLGGETPRDIELPEGVTVVPDLAALDAELEAIHGQRVERECG